MSYTFCSMLALGYCRSMEFGADGSGARSAQAPPSPKPVPINPSGDSNGRQLSPAVIAVITIASTAVFIAGTFLYSNPTFMWSTLFLCTLIVTSTIPFHVYPSHTQVFPDIQRIEACYFHKEL